MRRFLGMGIVVLVLAAAPLLSGDAFAGGAFNPPLPNGSPDTSDNITAIIVLDPNGPVPFGVNFNDHPVTQTGTFGAIEITRPGFGTAAANFQVQPGSTLGNLKYGCNLDLTTLRFVGQSLGGPDPFANWMPSGLTVQLFAQLGIDLTSPTIKVPAVFSVISQSCEAFPKANKTEQALAFGDIVAKQKVNPAPLAYPDLSANSDTFAAWAPGFLVLTVQIALWQ